LLHTSSKATQLKPGMILAKNLYNDSHILILPEGHVLTETTIQKLIKFEQDRGKAFDIHIEPPALDKKEEDSAS
jgi:hypothetical protein